MPEMPILTDDDTAASDLRDQLERAIRGLSVEHRTVLVLHLYVGLPLTEIAEILGVPSGTVRSPASSRKTLVQAAVAAAERSPLAEAAGMTAAFDFDQRLLEALEEGPLDPHPPTTAPSRAAPRSAPLPADEQRHDEVLEVEPRLAHERAQRPGGTQPAEARDGETAHAYRLRPAALPEHLVDLNADERRHRGDEKVGGQHQERGQAADRRLEVGEVADVDAEEDRGHHPAADDQRRAEAGPARTRLLRRAEADEQRRRAARVGGSRRPSARGRAPLRAARRSRGARTRTATARWRCPARRQPPTAGPTTGRHRRRGSGSTPRSQRASPPSGTRAREGSRKRSAHRCRGRGSSSPSGRCPRKRPAAPGP